MEASMTGADGERGVNTIRLALAAALVLLVFAFWIVMVVGVDCSRDGMETCDGDEVRGAFVAAIYAAVLGLPVAGAIALSAMPPGWPREKDSVVLWGMCATFLALSGALHLVLAAAWLLALDSEETDPGTIAWLVGLAALGAALAVAALAAARRSLGMAGPAPEGGPLLSRRTAPVALGAIGALLLFPALGTGSTSRLLFLAVVGFCALMVVLSRRQDSRRRWSWPETAVALMVSALALYLYACLVATLGDCPPSADSHWGSSDEIVDWPPGRRCRIGGEEVSHQPLPWIDLAILGLAASGAFAAFMAALKLPSADPPAARGSAR
jgi:hypothetical protein